MTPERELSKLRPVPVHMLPEMTFDMTGGQPVDPNLPRLQRPPVTYYALDFNPTEHTRAWMLLLTLQLDPAARLEHLVPNVVELVNALSAFEKSVGADGRGLKSVPPTPADDPGPGVLRLLLDPVNPTGAKERLERVVSAIRDERRAVSPLLLRKPFDRFTAAVVEADVGA